MRKKRTTLWIVLPLVLLLIVLSGCQSVGSLDIQKAMVSNLDVQSIESNQTLSVHLTPASSASAQNVMIAEVLNNSKLIIDHAKMESPSEMSLTGAVEYVGQRLPFHLYMNNDGVTIDLEGAKQPIYISYSLYEQATGLSGVGFNFAAVQEQQREFTKAVASFLFKHLPNPSNIAVDSVSTDVYGETLDLTRLHTELDGKEVLELVKPFLTSMTADEQGIKDLIGAFYDYYAPIIAQSSADSESSAASMFGDRDTFVQEGYTSVKETLDEVLKEYDQNIADLKQDESFNTVFGPETRVTADVYFDSDLHARKQNLDVTIALPADGSLDYTSINIHTESDAWNINGSVTAEPVDVSGGTLNISENTTPGTILRNFDSSSPIFKLLNLADISRKTVYIGDYSDYDDIIVRNKISYIPAKDLAEALDAKMQWNASTKQLTFTDDITGAVTVLKVNSKQATVDGQAKTLPANVIQVKGKTYVPVRAVAGFLGATVTSSYGDIVIERK
ncbi:copper amine oxidase N-terminal domain-containing protein [Paenibacillus sp. WLX1005]|uniref:copper amine oxidase N-terminal domain-containing protein n=1 Tax=Paenibacillus sp. WLX1005 TaxID=3243766 RepID=UPI00398439C2